MRDCASKQKRTRFFAPLKNDSRCEEHHAGGFMNFSPGPKRWRLDCALVLLLVAILLSGIGGFFRRAKNILDAPRSENRDSAASQAIEWRDVRQSAGIVPPMCWEAGPKPRFPISPTHRFPCTAVPLSAADASTPVAATEKIARPPATAVLPEPTNPTAELPVRVPLADQPAQSGPPDSCCSEQDSSTTGPIRPSRRRRPLPSSRIPGTLGECAKAGRRTVPGSSGWTAFGEMQVQRAEEAVRIPRKSDPEDP